MSKSVPINKIAFVLAVIVIGGVNPDKVGLFVIKSFNPSIKAI